MAKRNFTFIILSLVNFKTHTTFPSSFLLTTNQIKSFKVFFNFFCRSKNYLTSTFNFSSHNFLTFFPPSLVPAMQGLPLQIFGSLLILPIHYPFIFLFLANSFFNFSISSFSSAILTSLPKAISVNFSSSRTFL